MKKSLYLFCIFILFTAVSCIKDEQAYTTFTGELVYSFLQKDSTYSEYVKILDKAGLKGMLSSYSKFTCFAPTNSAMREYYRFQGRGFNLDSLRPGQLDTLAKSHILPNIHHTYEFTNGVLPSYNLTYDYLEVHFDDQHGGIMMNGSSRIISKDNDVYNGVVHGINRVLKQMISRLPDLMAQDSIITIFHAALRLTHLSDSMNAQVDISQLPPSAYAYNLRVDLPYTPQFKLFYSPNRRYGYTAFVEPNRVLEDNGIHSIADLIARAKQLYPSASVYDTDYTNRENSLNKYISYHLINKAIYNNRIFYARNAIKGYTPDEFLETMLTNRIIRVSNVNAQTVFNTGSNNSVHVEEAYDMRTQNGAYYLVDRMLVYNQDVDRMLQSIRIRFDISSLFPELTNNNIRGTIPDTPFNDALFVFDSGYLSNITASPSTILFYSSGVEEFPDRHPYFQSDVLVVEGFYDFSIRLLPVPPGTYQLRVGTRSGMSSIAQIYVDNKPMGIPVNFKMGLYDKMVGGFIKDSETLDDGAKYDQILYQKGYVKAPNSFYAGTIVDGNSEVTGFNPARNSGEVFRKIVGIFSFTDYSPHTIRFRSVSNTVEKFQIDYFELVPKSIFNPGEGLYESRD